MSDHGRIIPLTAEPYELERHVEVFAWYAVDLDEPTLAAEVAKYLADLRQRGRGNRVEIRGRSRMVLAGCR